MRRGEALALTWDDVNLEAGYVEVRQSLVRRSTGLTLESPKTVSGERTIDLDSHTVELLRGHRANQDLNIRRTREMGLTYNHRGLVFADAKGGWTNPMRLTRAVKSLGRKAGHDAVTTRALRHFHASVALQQGTNIVVVSKRLGHSTVSITSDIYAHSLPGWQRQAAEDFAAAMASGGA